MLSNYCLVSKPLFMTFWASEFGSGPFKSFLLLKFPFFKKAHLDINDFASSSSEPKHSYKAPNWPMQEEVKQSYKSLTPSGFSQVWIDRVLAIGNSLPTMIRLLLRSKRRRLLGGTAVLLVALTLGGLAVTEFKTFYLEARYLNWFARKLSF